VHATTAENSGGFTAKPQTIQWKGGEIWQPYKAQEWKSVLQRREVFVYDAVFEYFQFFINIDAFISYLPLKLCKFLWQEWRTKVINVKKKEPYLNLVDEHFIPYYLHIKRVIFFHLFTFRSSSYSLMETDDSIVYFDMSAKPSMLWPNTDKL
jgi:hypothetical protein